MTTGIQAQVATWQVTSVSIVIEGGDVVVEDSEPLTVRQVLS